MITDLDFATTFFGSGANWSAGAYACPAVTAYVMNFLSAASFAELRGTMTYVKVEIG